MLFRSLRAMLDLAPRALPSPAGRQTHFQAESPVRKHVALLAGCAQQVLAPHINDATIRLLTRHGCEVAIAPEAGCCGALNHHLGQEEQAKHFAAANIAAWGKLFGGKGPDAVVINTSGCGTVVKDYGFMFREDKTLAEPAARIAAATRDISELMTELGLNAPATKPGLTVAYQSACSLQHGQRVTREPAALLAAAGFVVRDLPEAHLCCGSAGTYNMLQPEIASALGKRKAANIEATKPDLIAAGNIGCLTQIGHYAALPTVHTVEIGRAHV